MNLTRERITKIFEAQHWPLRWGPEGAALLGGFTLRQGSGIAGRSSAFFLWHDRTGWKSPSATTVGELRHICEPVSATLWFGVESTPLRWLADKPLGSPTP